MVQVKRTSWELGLDTYINNKLVWEKRFELKIAPKKFQKAKMPRPRFVQVPNKSVLC